MITIADRIEKLLLEYHSRPEQVWTVREAQWDLLGIWGSSLCAESTIQTTLWKFCRSSSDGAPLLHRVGRGKFQLHPGRVDRAQVKELRALNVMEKVERLILLQSDKREMRWLARDLVRDLFTLHGKKYSKNYLRKILKRFTKPYNTIKRDPLKPALLEKDTSGEFDEWYEPPIPTFYKRVLSM